MAPPLPIGGIPIRGGGLFITRPPNKSRLELGPLVDVEAAPNKSIEEGGLVAVGGGVGGAGRQLDEEGVVDLGVGENGAERCQMDSLEEMGPVVVSQVEVTASKPWQTPTVPFHLHGQRLRSGHRAYLAHCRPGKAEREKCCWAAMAAQVRGSSALLQAKVRG